MKLTKIVPSALGITLLLGSCGKQEAGELTRDIGYDIDNGNEAKAITVLRQMGFDDQGIPGNPEPRPFCFNTGGNCICDVERSPAVVAQLTALDAAIASGTQASFFSNNHYKNVFSIIDGEWFEPVQTKLGDGRLEFFKAEIEGDLWYFVGKPQHSKFSLKKRMDKAVVSLPIVEVGETSYDGGVGEDGSTHGM